MGEPGTLSIQETGDGGKTILFHASGRRWWHWRRQPKSIWDIALCAVFALGFATWVFGFLLSQTEETFQNLWGLNLTVLAATVGMLGVVLGAVIVRHRAAGNLLQKISISHRSLRAGWRSISREAVESFHVSADGRVFARTREGVRVLLHGATPAVGTRVREILEEWLQQPEAAELSKADEVPRGVFRRSGSGVGYRGATHEFELSLPEFVHRVPGSKLRMDGNPRVWIRRLLLLSVVLAIWASAAAFMRDVPAVALLSSCGLIAAYLFVPTTRGRLWRRVLRTAKVPARILRLTNGEVSLAGEVVLLRAVARVRVEPSSTFPGLHALLVLSLKERAVLRLDPVLLADAEEAADLITRALNSSPAV